MPNIVGVDIGKYEHQATILDNQGEVVGGTIKFSNSALGFNQFKTHLEKMAGKDKNCLVALEATAHYWLPLYLYLVDKGYLVQVFNPYQSDALRKVFLGRAKTDKLDAELVARLARLGSQKPTRFSGEELLSLRTLSRFRMEMVFQSSDTKRRIITILDLLFPEFEKLFTDVFDKKEKVLKIKQTAKNSVGVSLCSEALVFQLTTIPGIGPVVAAVILWFIILP